MPWPPAPPSSGPSHKLRPVRCAADQLNPVTPTPYLIMLRTTIETTTTETASPFGGEVESRTERRIVVHGKACVSLTASCIEVQDGYGEPDRVGLTYWADSDEILSAMVDYVAALRRSVDRATENGDLRPGAENYTAARSLEHLSRIVGAAGLALPAA